MFKKLEEKYRDNGIWQFIKFNLVSMSTFLVQLLLANVLPLLLDRFSSPLPGFLSWIFDPEMFFDGPSSYVVNGTVTWGFVLPFFLSNFLANIYSYFVNMRFTFRGKWSRKSLLIYFAVLFSLILFSTWMQGKVAALLMRTSLAWLSRSIAVQAAGLLQFLVLYPLEKYVLFKEKKDY